MYGNNFRPFAMPGNIPYTTVHRPFFNTGGIHSIFKGFHNINWNNILNNTSRTLGVVRDAIPVIKEVRPMINNMKSMIKIASVFKDETDTRKPNNNISNKKENSIKDTTLNNNINYNNEPNFFL